MVFSRNQDRGSASNTSVPVECKTFDDDDGVAVECAGSSKIDMPPETAYCALKRSLKTGGRCLILIVILTLILILGP